MYAVAADIAGRVGSVRHREGGAIRHLQLNIGKNDQLRSIKILVSVPKFG